MASPFPSQPQSRLLGAGGPIHALTYSSSPGTYILTGSADRAIRLYNPLPRPGPGSSGEEAGVGRLIQTYAAHGYGVLDITVARFEPLFTLHPFPYSLFCRHHPVSSPLRQPFLLFCPPGPGTPAKAQETQGQCALFFRRGGSECLSLGCQYGQDDSPLRGQWGAYGTHQYRVFWRDR